MSRSYFTQAQIFPYNYQDVIMRGNATKIDALFLREYLRRRHSIPELPNARPFEGGYTDIFATGVIEDVWHCDVTSLYPSVMLAFGYLPKNDALGVFGGMLRDLRAFRIEAKKRASAGGRSARARHTARASRHLQDPPEFLLRLSRVRPGPFRGFRRRGKGDRQGARDPQDRWSAGWPPAGQRSSRSIPMASIFARPRGSRSRSCGAGLAGELPEGIEVEFDKRYPAMFSYKAKNYALLEESGALILKGAALKSRGMEPYLREYLETFLRLLLQDEPEKAAALREELALRIRRREISIEALAKTEALQDSVASYLKKITASSRNRSAAFELAIKSGRNYQAGDQITLLCHGRKQESGGLRERPVRFRVDPRGARRKY